jgi:hypothetical protein
MGLWLGGSVLTLAVIAGILFQKNLSLNGSVSSEAQSIQDLQKKIDDQTDAINQTDSLRNQLAAAQADSSQAKAQVTALQNQASSLTNQLTDRDQTIRQEQSQVQLLTGQVQQLNATNNATTAQLNDLQNRYASAMARLNLTVSPTLTPTQSAMPIYPTRSTIYAQSNEAATLANQQAALNRVNDIATDLRTQFEALPDYVQAKGNLDAAQDAYDSAQRSVLTTLQSNPDYVTALAAKKTAAQSVNDGRTNEDPPDEMAKLAQAALDANTAVTTLESTAMANSPDVQDAKTRLSTARAAMKELNAQFQNILAASQAYQQAKVDYSTAVTAHSATLANVQAIQAERDREAAEADAIQRQEQLDAWTANNGNMRALQQIQQQNQNQSGSVVR